MVERSLCMRRVRGSTLCISKTFLRLRQFYLVLADKTKELTTSYKSKADLSWILLTSYLKAWRVRERSSIGRALVSHARGTGIDAPHLQNIFEDSTILLCSGWQKEGIDNSLKIDNWYFMNFVQKLARRVRERSWNGRALALHAKSTGIDSLHLQNIFEASTILSGSGWQNERIDN